jgi:hypothetical protein
MVPIVIASHLLFGLGVAIILRAELALARHGISRTG